MAASLNKAFLIGNSGKDAELKANEAGQTMSRFSLATTDSWKDKQGKKQEKTEWHNIVSFGKLAEIASTYVKKGCKVMVEGKLSYGEYTDSTGAKKASTSIIADNIIVLSRPDEDSIKRKPQTSPDVDYDSGLL